MIAGVPKETDAGERRVALVPALVPSLVKAGFDVLVEAGAGEAAGFSDAAFVEKGARLAPSPEALWREAEVVFQVRGAGSNPDTSAGELARLRPGQAVIGFFDPLSNPDEVAAIAATGACALSMELMPRITRAQSMDALSSMATVAGYKAVLVAANALPKMFPMLMTAAGTVAPAKVFIVGVGVAGLQAIATARRLGAVVQAYDVRPAVKEQVESVGARFVELPLDTEAAEGQGGYAKAQDEAFYRKQRELMARVVAECDVVITTAAIPGRKAPVLVTAEMVRGMMPGSVIVDLAAERGGNCELTRPGEVVVEHGVAIHGPLNLPSTVPHHASQLYAKNIVTFLLHLAKEGKLALDADDQILRETLLTRDGAVVEPRVRGLLGLPEAGAPAQEG
ncbi:MAG: Re/Si-specific NAD(P)(+) transhydrogenase subunit alpha [Bryobacterales bacterium]|nr:Re/Si-specific NAD(P)(+) transhydrogenase subunit alpha [Bryobacterales bacterium]